MSDDKTYVKHVKTGEVFEVIHGSPPLCRAVWDKNGEEHVFIDDMLTPYDPDADVRKRCEQVFRDATGHPSFIGRDGVDLRDVFTEMIRAAYADGLAASGRELRAIRDTVGDTEFALRQQLADMTRERDEAQRSKNQCVIELYQKLDKLDDLNRDLKQQLAEAQGTVDSVNRQLAKEDASRIHLEQQVTRLREALQLIANSVYTDAAPPELRAQNERVCCLAQQALRETGAGGQP